MLALRCSSQLVIPRLLSSPHFTPAVSRSPAAAAAAAAALSIIHIAIAAAAACGVVCSQPTTLPAGLTSLWNAESVKMSPCGPSLARRLMGC